jgi:hypothetical protein
MDFSSASLDRYITGNWGEDSVAPEFVKAQELGGFGVDEQCVIDVAPQDSEHSIPATVTGVTISSGFVYIETKEFAHKFILMVDDIVYFADVDD